MSRFYFSMEFAENNSRKTEALLAVLPFVKNGFDSRCSPETLTEREVCPREKGKLRYKQNLASGVVSALLLSKNPLMMAQALRIERCNSDGNLFVASDLHTQDGELFDGKGGLWACGSRLCPNCTGKLSKGHRKTIRYVMENQKLMVGENWYFITFTMPNLKLKDLPLPLIAGIMQAAWKHFSTLEGKNKKPNWFQKTIRGGFKNCEFTFTKNSIYNYHLHNLFVAKSTIQRDNFVEIRAKWTEALKSAFKKFDIPFEVNTKDKLANVNVKKVYSADREKTINELCKYVTKNDSWSKIPLEQLETIVGVPRFWRMFEPFGVCRITARQMKENAVKTSANADNETVNQSVNFNTDAYLDTKQLINRKINARKTLRRVSWRIRAKAIPIWQYRMELADEIAEVQAFRRRQLLAKFPFATFQTLDGEVF